MSRAFIGGVVAGVILGLSLWACVWIDGWFWNAVGWIGFAMMTFGTLGFAGKLRS